MIPHVLMIGSSLLLTLIDADVQLFDSLFQLRIIFV